MTRTRWLVALIVVVELGTLATHPGEAKAIMRAVYSALWAVTPNPYGFAKPDRFR